jgi:hypothetical protein
MSELIAKINDILNDWKEQFDVSGNIPLSFALNEQGQLSYNGKALLFTDVPALEGASFDAERISFYLSDGRHIYVDLEWPEDETPFVTSVFLGYVF